MLVFPSLSAPRPRNRRGAGIPAVDHNKLPRGMVAFPIYVGRRMFDPVRGMWGPVRNPFGGFPPDYFGEATPVGFASRSWFTYTEFTGLPASVQNRHTIEALIWCSDTPSSGRIVTRGNELKLSINGSAQFACEIFDGGVKSGAGSTTLVARKLYHLAVCYDGTTARLYVDGMLDGSFASGQPVDNYGTTLNIHSASGGEGLNTLILAAGSAGVCWSEGEVRARVRNPWEHLIWFDTVQLSALKKNAATTISWSPTAVWI